MSLGVVHVTQNVYTYFVCVCLPKLNGYVLAPYIILYFAYLSNKPNMISVVTVA